jgi:choice-of-anchor C domain-containing protein
MNRMMIFAFRASRHLALAGALVGAAVVPACANISNGTFAGTVTGGAAPFFQNVNQGDTTTIPGWTVTPRPNTDQGSVDWIGSYWVAPGGTQSVDLDGNTPGGIAQTVLGTVAGRVYKLNFELSQNPDNGPATNTLNVITGSIVTPLSITGHSAYNTVSGYEAHTITFTATGSSTYIGFASTDAPNDAFGAVIADVTLTPEPSFYALLGIGLVGLFAFSQSRRRA